MAVALANDSVNRSETKPGAFAVGLAGEKWLKDLGTGPFVHTGPGVGNLQNHPMAFPGGAFRHILWKGRHVARGDRS